MSRALILISSSDLTKPAADQFRFLAIARGVSEHGVLVNWLLLASKLPGYIANDSKYQGINFISFGKTSSAIRKSKAALYLYRLFQLASLAPVISSLRIKSDQNALFSVGYSFTNLMLIKRLCRRQNILLFHERTEYPFLNSGSLLKKLNLYLYLNIFIPRCDHIFVISKALEHFFSQHKTVRKNDTPITILNMMVEGDRYQLNMEPEAYSYKDIVYVGTMYGDKDGVYNLIKAFGLIMDEIPESRLVLVGDNIHRVMMIRIDEALYNIWDKSRIIFTGALDRDAVIHRINQAYCLALARPNNIQAKYGFPTKLGEYLASAKPVIVTKVGDIPQFLRDGDNAYLAEPDDIVSFANKLKECLDDPEKAAKIGANGRKLVDTDFNYKKCTKVIVDALGSSGI